MVDFKKFTRLEKSLGYSFKNQDLLLEALSHPSLKQQRNKGRFDYERLEFLGDTILNFLITEILFNVFKEMPEGTLAKTRSYLVCTKTLCSVGNDLEIADQIIMTRGEENSGGRVNPSNLENVIEALIAAIYLDSNISIIRNIILKLWAKYLDNVGNLSDHDPKTFLQEWSQKNGYGVPIYEVISHEGSAHEPLFTIKVLAGKYSKIGQGKSIKLAQKEAAKQLFNFVQTLNE